MRAAENNRVATAGQQRIDIPLQQRAQLGTVQIAAFNQLNQTGARLSDHAHIGGEAVEQGCELGTLQSASGGKHTDHAAAGSGGGRFDRRLHADNRPVGKVAAQIGNSRHGRGIAGNHQRLGALLAEKTGHHIATLTDEFRGFLAIRNVPAIGEVQQRLIGQQALNFSQYRQTADTGIEHADRRLTHAAIHRRCNPDHV